MREIPFPEAAKDGHLSPPATTSTLPSPSPPPASRCYVNRCPRSSSEEFKANTVLVFVFLFGVLICGLAFHATIHYLCMRRRRMETAEQKVELENAASEQERVIPAVIYSKEMKIAGVVAECVICLSEIAIGERIRVLEKCSHGFHAQCIYRWLLSRSSCPTCRTNSQ